MFEIFLNVKSLAVSDVEAAKVEAKIQEIIHRHFWQDEGPEGVWPDLKPTTWRYKHSNKMLFESGEYLKSWQVELQGDDFIIGSESKIAQYHEFGTTHIPVRSFVWLNESDIGEIAGVYFDEFERIWSG